MPNSCVSLSSKASSRSTKPMNVFYVWYAELCRRANTSPLSIVKAPKPKNETVLDFNTDRIKPEEWAFILNALRLDTSLHVIAIRSRASGCQFLHDVDTEEKAQRMTRRCAALWTNYVFSSVLRALNVCLRNNPVLSSLELDGLPLTPEYFQQVLPAIKDNAILKSMSFKRCPIGDSSCQQLCNLLKNMPNVEVLNLSGCSLSAISAQNIASLIKHQQIRRYCESWHNSLRYEDPSTGYMIGLKRLTLNANPGFGDEGLSFILDQLEDDLWIKALDMQKCNITEKMSRRIVSVVEQSMSLEIADFRDNENLSFATVEKIMEVLQRRNKFGSDSEYQWCVTSTTLYDFGSFQGSRSTLLGSHVIQKSRSAPLGHIQSLSTTKPLKRTKTAIFLDRNPSAQVSEKKQLIKARKELSAVHARLQMEINKRKEIHKKNVELQKKLEKTERGTILKDGDKDTGTKFKQTVSKMNTTIKINTKKSQATNNVVLKPHYTDNPNNSPQLSYSDDTFRDEHPSALNILKSILSIEKDESEDEALSVADALGLYEDIQDAHLLDPDEEEDDDSTGSNASLERFLEEINSKDTHQISPNTNTSPRYATQNSDKNEFSKLIVKVCNS